MAILPKVSIICASYNHEKFVEFFLTSVLAQTCPDWELIVIDDASTDKTVELIRQVEDPRIRVEVNARNRGVNYGLNRGFALARAPIIAFCASDDALFPSYVESVLTAIGPDATDDVVLPPLQVMDETGADCPCVMRVRPEEAHGEALAERMFLRDNFLQSPGIALRRTIAERLFPLPESMLQMQDVFMLLVSTCFGRTCFLERPIVRYRIVSTSISHSVDEKVLHTQLVAETQRLLSIFAEKVSREPEVFCREFAAFKDLWSVATPTTRDIPFWLALIAMRSVLPARRLWGLSAAMRFWDEADNADYLFERYGIKFADLRKILKSADPIAYYDDRALGITRRELVPGLSVVRTPHETKLCVFGLRLRFKKKRVNA